MLACEGYKIAYQSGRQPSEILGEKSSYPGIFLQISESHKNCFLKIFSMDVLLMCSWLSLCFILLKCSEL